MTTGFFCQNQALHHDIEVEEFVPELVRTITQEYQNEFVLNDLFSSHTKNRFKLFHKELIKDVHEDLRPYIYIGTALCFMGNLSEHFQKHGQVGDNIPGEHFTALLNNETGTFFPKNEKYDVDELRQHEFDSELLKFCKEFIYICVAWWMPIDFFMVKRLIKKEEKKYRNETRFHKVKRYINELPVEKVPGTNIGEVGNQPKAGTGLTGTITQMFSVKHHASKKGSHGTTAKGTDRATSRNKHYSVAVTSKNQRQNIHLALRIFSSYYGLFDENRRFDNFNDSFIKEVSGMKDSVLSSLNFTPARANMVDILAFYSSTYETLVGTGLIMTFSWARENKKK